MTGTVPTTERLSIAFRSLAAAVGGYFFASSFATLLAAVAIRAGLMSQAGAVSAASALTFALWCASALWVFHVRGVLRVWVALLASGLAAAILAKLLLDHGG